MKVGDYVLRNPGLNNGDLIMGKAYKVIEVNQYGRFRLEGSVYSNWKPEYFTKVKRPTSQIPWL